MGDGGWMVGLGVTVVFLRCRFWLDSPFSEVDGRRHSRWRYRRDGVRVDGWMELPAQILMLLPLPHPLPADVGADDPTTHSGVRGRSTGHMRASSPVTAEPRRPRPPPLPRELSAPGTRTPVRRRRAVARGMEAAGRRGGGRLCVWCVGSYLIWVGADLLVGSWGFFFRSGLRCGSREGDVWGLDVFLGWDGLMSGFGRLLIPRPAHRILSLIPFLPPNPKEHRQLQRPSAANYGFDQAH